MGWKRSTSFFSKHQFGSFKQRLNWPQRPIAFLSLNVEDRGQKRWIVKHADVESEFIVVDFSRLEVEVAEVRS